ncbi:hypothetical protein BS78_K341200 [Paspalum vaginatum]|uniref:non-specific serine/threonine protein kinase n=1 Tax=Paspalum vaginatum TaxID=158149 RepID=A0A9W8CGB8_9POAL|nr:hypothetical protein BS78_K341200 [Paspalum vaginatum]
MDIAKLAGFDAVKLVVMIVQAAQTVRYNKKTCQQLVHRVQIIGDLLKNMPTSEMMQHPEIRNGLSDIDEILREAYMFVMSFQNNNWIYHLITAKKKADQLRVLQNRMDSCLQVFPLISHIDTADRLDKILEIVRPPQSQAAREVAGLLECGSSCDIRKEVSGRVKRFCMQYAESFTFNLSQLADATNNFSDENQIGQGGFGYVYKGQLHDGVVVAVKRCFELPSPKQLNSQELEFKNEISFLTKLEHTNIVKLLGACMQGRERILVYEYMAKGSLDAFIFGPRTRRLYLDWPTCSQIIKGIAEGLLYLHKYSGLHIVHGDLKSSNILLDTDMKPKISDFGLARVYNPEVDQEFADHIVRSMGFVAPECQERRLFSTKSDVYCFRALLLEVISGDRCFSLASGESGYDHGFLNKRNDIFVTFATNCCYMAISDDMFSLLLWVWGLWRAGRLDKFVYLPPGDKSETERMEILRCIQIALLCVEEDPENRPAMQDVVHMLSCQNFALPKPQRPAYLM